MILLHGLRLQLFAKPESTARKPETRKRSQPRRQSRLHGEPHELPRVRIRFLNPNSHTGTGHNGHQGHEGHQGSAPHPASVMGLYGLDVCQRSHGYLPESAPGSNTLEAGAPSGRWRQRFSSCSSCSSCSGRAKIHDPAQAPRRRPLSAVDQPRFGFRVFVLSGRGSVRA
jgi:hypothetical protein